MASSKIDARIAEWKRRLIDLTRRNRLLFFTSTRSSTLHVIEPSPDEIFQRLVVDEKQWMLLIPPEEEAEEEDPPRNLDLPLTTAEVAQGEPSPRKLIRRANELICRAREARRLRAVLRNIHRRSRSDFEERGVRILHMVFGLLEWRETPESDPIRSPLVLVPVQISRASANDPFELSIAGEDIVLNPAIAVRLQSDFRIDLSPIPEDWEEMSLNVYLNGIAEQISPQRNWRVHQECWLGLFSFHKLVMYQDLDSHADLIKQNEIIRALAQEPDATDVANGDILDPQELDNLIHPRESYLIMDADSSQLACIEAVKRGVNLIVQGPPGTGKSQTIANLIAESIAKGFTVLFMSEKMAALEVVYKRLLRANLGHYCLELHSHKANKREVVRELHRCCLESLQPKAAMTELEFEQLTNRRLALNDYVYALHLIRAPLGKSAYDVLGELADLERVEFVPHGDIQPENLTPGRIDPLVQLAHRLATVWKVVIDSNFPWRNCTATYYGPETRAKFQDLIQKCEEALTRLCDQGREMASSLGASFPVVISDVEWIVQVAELLQEGPGVEESWLTNLELDGLVSQAAQYRALSLRHEEVRNELAGRYQETFFQLPATLKEKAHAASESVALLLGRKLRADPKFVTSRGRLLRWARDFNERVNDWVRDARLLHESLDVPGGHNIIDLKRLVRIAELCHAEDRPDQKWFDAVVLADVAGAIANFRTQCETRTRLRAAVLTDYETSLLSLDLGRLIETLTNQYASPLRWFCPGFYRLRKVVRRCRRDQRNSPNILRDLRQAQELVRLEAKLDGESEQLKQTLGAWYRGYETNFEHASAAIQVVTEILQLLSGRPSQQLIDQAALGRFPLPELQQATKRLKESLLEWENGTDAIAEFVSLDWLQSTRLPLRESSLETVHSWAKELLQHLEIVGAHLDAVEATIRPALEHSVDDITSDLAQLESLRDGETQMTREEDRLLRVYGNRFAGLKTDWDRVIAAMNWVSKLQEKFGDRDVPRPVRQIAMQGAASAPSSKPLRDAIRNFKLTLGDLDANFERRDPKAGLLATAAAELDKTSEPMVPNSGSFVERQFEELRGQLKEMRERVEEIRDWIDYRIVEDDFRQANLQELYSQIIRRLSLRPENLPGIIRRALLQAWIDWVFQHEPALGRFRAENHETLITEFRELDRKHWSMGSHRVILEAERRKPKDGGFQRGGELAVLSREANKKKRHLPIRKLFSQLPQLLTRLKPCLLMSPISVSQFLDPQLFHFDRIIFDEASQICSWDAVGAIYRGRQLVVCGDNKQLPPTAFFEQGMSDEYEDQDGEQAFDVFDSILDECAGIGMPSSWLRWHYRSRHEDLIAFSNHRFYESRLVTFPAALKQHPSLGLEFRFVRDGVYDRGGRSDNPREADVVADLVVEHFLRRNNKSLGVVAFSVAQMDAIEDRIEYRRRQRPELERYFGDDRLEGFFVKNLENVQGDERDVMIFSVGYGRDQQGRMTMSFGPLNQSGGERRLNVAVTRAREKVIVVSSIRAADFDLQATNKAGVLALYHYLDYAERGPKALLLHHPGVSGDFETPLEKDVAGAIRALGYQVLPQIGCSGFRIDLGVLDPKQPGRFMLGVECDGATYHSAYTARDRDRLRQEVLEKLGWKIHRIWAPDWVNRRQTEISRLRQAIEQASVPQIRPEKRQQESKGDLGLAAVVVKVQPEPPDRNDKGRGWAVAYEACRIQTEPLRSVQFHDPSAAKTLAYMLNEVIEAEGPVHIDLTAKRLAERWGLKRTGARMVSAVKAALGILTTASGAAVQGSFIWPKKKDFILSVRRPNPEDKETFRKIEFISDEELELAVQNIVCDAMSITEDQLITEVTRVFGFDRTGASIRDRIERNLNGSIQAGTLVIKGDRIAPGKN